MSQTQPMSSAPAGLHDDARGGSRHLGVALLLIATAQLMVVLDATIVYVALPHIQRALGFSNAGLEWVVNAYALTFGGLLLLGKPSRWPCWAEHRGRVVTGLLLFSASLAGRRVYATCPRMAAGGPRHAGRRQEARS